MKHLSALFWWHPVYHVFLAYFTNLLYYSIYVIVCIKYIIVHAYEKKILQELWKEEQLSFELAHLTMLLE